MESRRADLVASRKDIIEYAGLLATVAAFDLKLAENEALPENDAKERKKKEKMKKTLTQELKSVKKKVQKCESNLMRHHYLYVTTLSQREAARAYKAKYGFTETRLVVDRDTPSTAELLEGMEPGEWQHPFPF